MFLKRKEIHKLLITGVREDFKKALLLSITTNSDVIAILNSFHFTSYSSFTPYNSKDNTLAVTIPFIVGFILGDGSLSITLRKSANGNIVIVPLVRIFTKNLKRNLNLFELMLNQLHLSSIPATLKETSSGLFYDYY